MMSTGQTKNTIALGIISLFVLTLFVLLVLYPIYGADFYYVFYPFAKGLWTNEVVLYTDTAKGFLNPAHAMFYWMPLALLPVAIANALHVFITFGLLFGIVQLWSNYVTWSFFRTILAILGLYTIDHLIRGQMDVIAVFGVVLAFFAAKEEMPYLLGLSATIAVIKPTSLLFPLLIIAWHLRQWSLAQIGRAAVIPILTILATLLVFGAEWIPNLLAWVEQGTPVDSLSALSIYDMAKLLALPNIIPIIISMIFAIGVIKYRTLTPTHFAFALAANLLASTYMAGYHFVVLIPAILTMKYRWMVIVAFILSLLPIGRIIGVDEAINLEYLMVLLPVFTVSVMLWQIIHAPDESSPESEGQKRYFMP